LAASKTKPTPYARSREATGELAQDLGQQKPILQLGCY
jgi:hypothetical protein